MTKKVIITGSRSGLGLWIKESLISLGHSTIDFNLSDGNDISLPQVQRKLLDEAKNADIFINNAHSGYAQCQLLTSIFEHWQNEPKYIINIGCSQFNSDIWNLVEHSYVSEKAALHVLVARLQQLPRLCKLTTIKPGVMATSNTSKMKMNMNKVPKDELRKCIEFLISISNTTEIRSICLDSIQTP